MIRRAVFLDRDGTINVNKPYLYKIADLEFLPGAVEAIRLLNENNYLVIVVTNQSGVARNYFSEADVITLHNYINRRLKLQCAHIDKFYFCPHHEQKGVGQYKRRCNCRKPDSGMIEKAIQDFQLDKHSSYLIGDQVTDLKAGSKAGLKRSLLVNSTVSLIQIVRWIIKE